ncbi:hypothetical protein R1flu_024825 [Riccia fluitans]|uniref:Radical SAM core domain-containing protein n=1 Tax=Riccia fluitans TaxID=41844 RepID=A0ABD1XW03_9MARC
MIVIYVTPIRNIVFMVGLVPRIVSLANDLPGVNLALSLHAPTQDLRVQIVPAARAYNLLKLMAAIDCYSAASKRQVFIEYIMIGGVNDSDEAAHQLGSLLSGRQVVLNLIPYNPTETKADFKASREDAVHNFQKTIREMGQDIAGACGQLAVGDLKRTSLSARKVSLDIPDIEELFTVPGRRMVK